MKSAETHRGESRAVISVIGPSQASPGLAETAQMLGAALARAGHVVLTGGGPGVMEAACRGALQEGGETVGLLPGVEPREANPAVRVALPTGLGHARNHLVVLGGVAVIAVGSSPGTLSEMALAAVHGRPLCLLDAPSALPGIPAHRAADLADALRWLGDLLAQGTPSDD